MKHLVLYSSKYGTTKDCAAKIAKAIEGELYSLDQKHDICLDKYDTITLGTSIYIGKLRKSTQHFITANQDILLKKPLNIFVCCNASTDYEALFSKQLVKHCANFTHIGFELRISKMNFLDRFITKKVGGTTEDINEIKYDTLNEFIEKLPR